MKKLQSLSEKKREEYIENLYTTDFNGFKLRKPFDEFVNGLKFDIDYLNSIGKNVLLFPMEIALEYADEVCINMLSHSPEKLRKGLLGNTLSRTPYDILEATNATGIGNLAYIAYHHPDPQIKISVESMLDAMAELWILECMEYIGLTAKGSA